MPLMQGKSPKAMSDNISTEMAAGKPQKQAIAIAYAVKRRNQHKAHGGMMAHGGEVNEKLHPEHEPMGVEHPMVQQVMEHPEMHSIVSGIMQKHKEMCAGGEAMAEGGEVEMNDLSESGDDFLTDDDEFETQHLAEGGMVDDEEEDEDKKKKGRLGSIMDGLGL